MVALVARYVGPSNSRGAHVRVGYAEERGSKSFGWDHSKQWIANADEAVARFAEREPVLRAFVVKGGAPLGPAKRVYLLAAE